MNLNIIREEEFTIRVVNKGEKYKIFKIKFYKKDGSIFLFFPYFKHSHGILSILKLPANIKNRQTLRFDEVGKITSHLVKYSHRPDGNVHFSLDKKIFTFKKNKKADPLSCDVGHIFKVIFKNLDAFEVDNNNNKTLNIDFNVNTNNKNDFKILCEWKKIPNYNYFDKKLNPVVKTKEGIIEKDKIIGQPTYMPYHDHILTFDLYEKSLNSTDSDDLLLFIGGFDPKFIYKDLSKDFYCLAMMYPAGNYLKLEKIIGSQDFVST